jgi:hypothetical protein
VLRSTTRSTVLIHHSAHRELVPLNALTAHRKDFIGTPVA